MFMYFVQCIKGGNHRVLINDKNELIFGQNLVPFPFVPRYVLINADILEWDQWSILHNCPHY